MFKTLEYFKEPIILKEGTSLKRRIEFLNNILENTKSEYKEEIKKQLNILNYGLKGEEQIKYELLNSHIPMYILHDIYLEEDNLTAQIDYIVVTKSGIYLLECKNLYGNITIDNKENFIRQYEYNGQTIKEGIYSPITQNERHLELIKYKIMKKNKLLGKIIVDRIFNDCYKSVVVLSNSKTILNDYYAKKEIKEKVIRCDQLINYLKQQEKVSKNNFSDKEMKSYAESLLTHHIEKENLEEIYSKYLPTQSNTESLDNDLRNKLKSFRLKKSQLEQIPPYYIFNDQILNDLIRQKPQSKEELIKIKGFGEYKCNKYGPEIIELIKEYEEII